MVFVCHLGTASSYPNSARSGAKPIQEGNIEKQRLSAYRHTRRYDVLAVGRGNGRCAAALEILCNHRSTDGQYSGVSGVGTGGLAFFRGVDLEHRPGKPGHRRRGHQCT
jgi:hypothetical protein